MIQLPSEVKSAFAIFTTNLFQCNSSKAIQVTEKTATILSVQILIQI